MERHHHQHLPRLTLLLPVANVTEDDLLGIWVGPREQVFLRFTEEGKYCLALDRDELDTFPGDCGTFEVMDMVLTLTSDSGYCVGEIGMYNLVRNMIGQLQMNAMPDACNERRSNINNKTIRPDS